ncbi:oxidoreductase, short chain dehydrogenase/reductase family protein [Ancylostoma duodenale]|uniref:Oxidoreductase, short chain dehydrogenase/reductase family protein n=1 Tax=Ancylostoma duodenale TaxID=51022 RepID=A0A0C2CS51_9BILA|nr:oxidoreductase, short chain dehydrogenase/reductase family protein [Ancylostoma duodenale]
MAPYSVLVTGANRGIGLGLVKEFLKNKDIQHVMPLLVIRAVASHVAAKVEKIVGDRGLALLLNNAGILLEYRTNQEPKRKDLIESFNVNVASAAVITQIFLPLLRKAAAQVPGNEFSMSRAAIVNISSELGSISNNTWGSAESGLLAYSTSKSALNSLMKTMSIDLEPDHILVVMFCPGWVTTDLGGPDARFTLDQSIKELVPSIYKLLKEHHGGYFNRDLSKIPF